MGTCFGIMGVGSLPRQCKYARTTKQIVIADVPWLDGELSRFEGASPSIQDQDIAACDAKTGGTSPGEYPITFNADGTYSFDSNGSETRQTFSVDVYSRLRHDWLGDTIGYVNNLPPVFEDTAQYGPFVFDVGSNGTDILLTDYVSDPEADTIAFSIIGADPSQPAWVTLSTDTLVIGTPATEDDVLITVRATDSTGESSIPDATFRLVSIDTITVPDYGGVDIGSAAADAEGRFLTPVTTGTGLVVSQSPAPGTEVEPFATITLSTIQASSEPEEGETLSIPFTDEYATAAMSSAANYPDAIATMDADVTYIDCAMDDDGSFVRSEN